MTIEIKLPKEKIYDEQIFPLVSQIISICREHKMAILFDANLGYDPQAGSDMKCTTALLSDDYHASSEMFAAFKILMGRSL
jgi:hypothetical protein